MVEPASTQFNWRVDPNGYPPKLIDKPRFSYRRLAGPSVSKYRLSRARYRPDLAPFDYLLRGITISIGASDDVGRAVHLSCGVTGDRVPCCRA